MLYEGTENKRRLERLYLGCLQLAAPELLSTMGMGMSETEDDGAPAGVGLDTVEKLRPVLKVKEVRSPRRAPLPPPPRVCIVLVFARAR